MHQGWTGSSFPLSTLGRHGLPGHHDRCGPPVLASFFDFCQNFAKSKKVLISVVTINLEFCFKFSPVTDNLISAIVIVALLVQSAQSPLYSKDSPAWKCKDRGKLGH